MFNLNESQRVHNKINYLSFDCEKLSCITFKFDKDERLQLPKFYKDFLIDESEYCSALFTAGFIETTSIEFTFIDIEKTDFLNLLEFVEMQPLFNLSSEETLQLAMLLDRFHLNPIQTDLYNVSREGIMDYHLLA